MDLCSSKSFDAIGVALSATVAFQPRFHRRVNRQRELAAWGRSFSPIRTVHFRERREGRLQVGPSIASRVEASASSAARVRAVAPRLILQQIKICRRFILCVCIVIGSFETFLFTTRATTLSGRVLKLSMLFNLC